MPGMDKYQHNTEQELLLQIADGDPFAYKVIFDRYWDMILANALHFTKAPELAKDLAQEIFMKIWVKRAKLTEVKEFQPYLFVVARNLIYDELRRLQQLPAHVELLQEIVTESNRETIAVIEATDLQNKINKAIEQLPPQMQEAFKLSRFEGLTHAQIAEKMHISKVTSQNYIARALISIRKTLLNEHIELALIFAWMAIK